MGIGSWGRGLPLRPRPANRWSCVCVEGDGSPVGAHQEGWNAWSSPPLDYQGSQEPPAA